MSIALRDVSVRQGAFLLDCASLEIPAGSYGVVLGAAGSGKTTLLETVAGIRAPDGGTLQLRGSDAARLAPGEAAVLVYLPSISRGAVAQSSYVRTSALTNGCPGCSFFPPGIRVSANACASAAAPTSSSAKAATRHHRLPLLVRP